MRRFELVLICIAALGWVLIETSITGGKVLFTLSMLILSFIYLLLGFALLNNIPLRQLFKKSSYNLKGAWSIVLGIIGGYGLNNAGIGILFAVMNWDGRDTMIHAGFSVGLFILLITLVSLIFNKKNVNVQILWRLIPMLLILFLYWY